MFSPIRNKRWLAIKCAVQLLAAVLMFYLAFNDQGMPTEGLGLGQYGLIGLGVLCLVFAIASLRGLGTTSHRS